MFTLHHRFQGSPSTLAEIRSHCERTEDYIWIGSPGSKGTNSKQRLRKYTLRGVPAHRLDLALIDADMTEAGVPVAIEIGKKAGRFDGAERTQVVVRHWCDNGGHPLPYGDIRIAVEDQANVPPDALGFALGDEPYQWVVLSASWRPRQVVFPAGMSSRGPKPERIVELAGGSWIEAHPQLRCSLNGYELRAIVIWHWSRYYQIPLTWEEADSVAGLFEAELRHRPLPTLAEANRLASRMLYDAGRRAGWHKLTLRERKRWGLESCGQWVRSETLLAAKGLLGHPTGVGEYTLDAANGQAMYSLPSEWEEQNRYTQQQFPGQ